MLCSLKRQTFLSFSCSQRSWFTFLCYSIVCLLQKRKCHCHVSAILTPAENGSTIMTDGSAQVGSHGNGHRSSTLEDQLVLQVQWFWILTKLHWTRFDPLDSLVILPRSPQSIFDVSRVLLSHLNTSYFYGLWQLLETRQALWLCCQIPAAVGLIWHPDLCFYLTLNSAKWGQLEDNQASFCFIFHPLLNINECSNHVPDRISWSLCSGGYSVVRFRSVLRYLCGCLGLFSLPSNCCTCASSSI